MVEYTVLVGRVSEVQDHKPYSLEFCQPILIRLNGGYHTDFSLSATATDSDFADSCTVSKVSNVFCL